MQRKALSDGGLFRFHYGATFTVYDTGKVEMPRLEEIFSQFDQWHLTLGYWRDAMSGLLFTEKCI